jgi:type I restriction enzyme S subunit
MEVVQTLQRYSKYKESRESWLGEIPEHWEEKKFKHIFLEKKKTTNIELNCGSISFGKVVYKDDEKVPESTKKSYQVLSKGDFLINPLNLNYDLISLRIALSDKDVVVSSGYIILNENLKLNKEYYKWLLHIFDVVYMKTLGSGVRQTLSFTHIANCELVFPPLEEQTAMAKFLEDKTALIDQAIAIKQKQIELLKERRQILIHKAVTRGLNDTVKLKDSGVEWIGEIPEHWEVKRFKHFTKILSGYSPEQVKFCSEIKINYFKVDDLNNVNEDFRLENSNWFVEKFKLAKIYSSNILLIPKRGGAIGTNKIAITTTESVFDTNVMGLEFNLCKVDIDLIAIWLKSRNLITIADVTTIPQINNKHIYPLEIALPCIDEQKGIIKYIKTSSQIINNAISLKEQEIEKMKEYKMSLIDGVVTGKIKVC